MRKLLILLASFPFLLAGCATGERVATSEIIGVATTQPVKLVGIDNPVMEAMTSKITQSGQGNIQNIGDKWAMRALIWFGGVASMIFLSLLFYLAYLVSHYFRRRRELCFKKDM